MSLLSILMKSLLSDGALSALAGKTGLSSAKLKKLLPLAVPLLLKALTNNASSQSGLQSLLGALTQHTDKKSLPEQIREADTADGGKILGHIFGGNSTAALSSLAQQSDLSEQEVGTALSSIAPALMSGLSAATASGGQTGFDLSDGLDMGDLMAIFGGGATQSGGGLFGGATQSGGGLFGGASQSGGGLLSSLFGGGAPSGGGLFGSLLGQNTEEKDDSLNGTALLNALLSGRR